MSGVSYSPDYEAPKRQPITAEEARALAARTMHDAEARLHAERIREAAPFNADETRILELEQENAQLRAAAEALRKRVGQEHTEAERRLATIRKLRNEIESAGEASAASHAWLMDILSEDQPAILGPPESTPGRGYGGARSMSEKILPTTDEERVLWFERYVAIVGKPPLTKDKLRALEERYPEFDWRTYLGLSDAV